MAKNRPTRGSRGSAKQRTRWIIGSLVVLVLVFSVPTTFAQQRRCTAAEAQRAELQADTLRNWDALYRSYKQYRPCDDGAIAEGYSESVARILVDAWSTLPRLAKLARMDVHFARFVLAHVDATLEIEDVKKIRTFAQTQCPSGLGPICTELAKQADAALKENAAVGIK